MTGINKDFNVDNSVWPLYQGSLEIYVPFFFFLWRMSSALSSTTWNPGNDPGELAMPAVLDVVVEEVENEEQDQETETDVYDVQGFQKGFRGLAQALDG